MGRRWQTLLRCCPGHLLFLQLLNVHRRLLRAFVQRTAYDNEIVGGWGGGGEISAPCQPSGAMCSASEPVLS